MNQGYDAHVKRCWKYSCDLAEHLIEDEDTEVQVNLALSIFNKCCSPYHYYLINEQERKSIRHH